MTARGALMLSEKDNVATLLEDVASGTGVLVRLGSETQTIKARESVTFGFKIAVSDIARGADTGDGRIRPTHICLACVGTQGAVYAVGDAQSYGSHVRLAVECQLSQRVEC